MIVDAHIVFEIVMALITGLIGLILAGVAWWTKTVWSMSVEQQKAINALYVKFGEYANRTEIDGKLNDIFEQLRELTRAISNAAAQARRDSTRT